jgi:uncharacterized membrane protein
MEQENYIETHHAAVAKYTMWLGIALGIAASFFAGVYWPY